jgi:beta-lactam-binding protein with PASTA domain
VRIPDVVGTPLDEAKARVERLGLGVRTTTTLQEVEDPGLQGKTKVARQSPQPDDIVLRSSATIVLLSAVQYGEGGVAVPQFQGLAYTDAKELAEELGLRLVVRTSATRITQNRDQHGRKLIDGQFTAAGTRVRKGTDIGVSVNQLVFQQPRPEYVAVPDLVNDRARETQFTVEQAIAIAKQAKFTPIISYRGQQFNEAGWAVLAASYLIPPNTPPQVRRDLQAFRALSIYQLRAGNQSPAPKTQAQPGDRIVIEVRVAASR